MLLFTTTKSNITTTFQQHSYKEEKSRGKKKEERRGFLKNGVLNYFRGRPHVFSLPKNEKKSANSKRSYGAVCFQLGAINTIL